jgi:hypothetical protein
MKNPLSKIFAASLAVLICSPLYAKSTSHTQTRNLITNSVSIHNKSNKDIAYRVISKEVDGTQYGIKRGKHDTYHAKFGDEDITFEVGKCTKLNKLSGICISVEGGSMANCVNNNHYDAYHIKRITITSPSSCTVTCDDGGKSSCVVK